MAKSMVFRDLYDALCVVRDKPALKLVENAIEAALSRLSELELIAYDVMDAEGKRQSAIARAKAAL